MRQSISPSDTKGVEGTGSKWASWYQPGAEEDGEIYSRALEKCKQVNQDINPEPFSSDRHGRIATSIVEGRPIRIQPQKLYDDAWITHLVKTEAGKVQGKRASKPEWARTVTDVAYGILGVAKKLKPIIDIFVPSSPEYSVPYACLWAIFKGFVAQKEKNDSVIELIVSLSEDIDVYEALKAMFPTDGMKTALCEFYLHTLDLLGRLAEYYSRQFFRQLGDALFPSQKYNFTLYRNNITKAARRLRLRGDIGHFAEQKDIKDKVDSIDSELRQLAQQLENTRLAQAQQYASDLIDIWDSDVGDIEHELQLWESLHFRTDMRNHWSQNGTLRCVSEWRQLCERSQNSILWISTESNGKQSWVTELSVDLIRILRLQGQRTAFGFCDRPRSVNRWSPKQLFKQLIAQLVNKHADLVMTRPRVFNSRQFRKSATMAQTFRLLRSVVASLDSVVIVIDRLDLCVLDPKEPQQPTVVEALSILVKAYPQTLRVILTTGTIVTPDSLPELPISFAMVSTRRLPRRRYEESSPPSRPLARLEAIQGEDSEATSNPRRLIPHS